MTHSLAIPKPSWHQRLRCFFGQHPATRETWAPFPYPSCVACASCGRKLHFIDRYAKVDVWTPAGWQTASDIRYASLEQWLEERE